MTNRKSGMISVLIPTYQDLPCLSRSLPVFLANHDHEIEIIILNNDASQDVHKWLRDELGTTHIDNIHVVQMTHNGGFSRAVNHGISVSRGDILFICNADLFPDAAFVNNMCDFLQEHRKAGLATGKVMRYDPSRDLPTNIVDTAGLGFARNRRFVARGEGEIDVGQFDTEQEVFGVDGAVIVARRSALNSIEIEGEYFDETFVTHKEDWDLSWRIRLMGWEVWYVPSAVAYHCRTTRNFKVENSSSGLRLLRENERAKPDRIRLHAAKNQWLMLLKNEDQSNLFRDLPCILFREAMVVGYNALFSPKTLRAIFEFARLARLTTKKRRVIKERQLVTAREVRQWLGRR